MSKVEPSQDTLVTDKFWLFDDHRLQTASGLALMSAAAVGAQNNGLTNSFPGIVEAIAESAAHPFPGYIGALAGVSLYERVRGRLSFVAALVGGVSTNFVAETGQHLIAAPSGEGPFWQNGVETSKDLAFALAGACLAWRHTHKPH